MDLLKKAVFIQGNVWKKDLLLLSAKLKETCKKKILILLMLRNITTVIWREKTQMGKTIRNNYLSTKSYRKPKHCDIRLLIKEH